MKYFIGVLLILIGIFNIVAWRRKDKNLRFGFMIQGHPQKKVDEKKIPEINLLNGIVYLLLGLILLISDLFM